MSAFDNGDDCDDHDLVGTARAARVMIVCGIITRRQNIGTFQGVCSLLSLFNSISNLEIKLIVYSLQLCYLIDELTQAKLRT